MFFCFSHDVTVHKHMDEILVANNVSFGILEDTLKENGGFWWLFVI